MANYLCLKVEHFRTSHSLCNHSHFFYITKIYSLSLSIDRENIKNLLIESLLVLISNSPLKTFQI
jgi:hypothetical protein